ncbi:MAG: hemolysin III family protein [Pirellulales bacterium]
MNAQLALAGPTFGLSESEELANRVTHGVGFVMSLIGAVVMTTIYGSDDPCRIAGCSIYLTSLIAVYAMSTLSHTFQEPRRRSFFRALDQGSIYLLVAATYTPFSMAYLHSAAWWILLGLVWLVALWGFFSKVLYGHRVDSVSMWPCILVGAMPFIAIPTLLEVVNTAALWWMMLGVGCYILGLAFWLNDRRVRHFHAVWHLLVIAGSMTHFMGILLFVVRVA